MNYAVHYDGLIARAKTRVLIGYRERHHVLPRCAGGTNHRDNLVDLTAEEHFVAHQLLVKMYPAHRGLALAAAKMAGRCTRNKAYGWLRRKLAEALLGNKHTLGYRHTETTKSKMSIARRGYRPSAEAIAKTAAFWTGRKHSPETRAKISNARRGKPTTTGMIHSAEARAKIAIAHIGKPLSSEHRAKIIAANTGREKSPDERAKLSAALRGKPKSQQHRVMLSLAAKRYWANNALSWR